MEIEPNGGQRSEIGKEATKEQLTASRIAFYMDLLEISGSAAQDFARSKGDTENLDKKSVKQLIRETRTALVDLYFIREQGLDTDAFDVQWGERATDFKGILEGINPELDQRSEELNQKAPNINSFERAKILLKARKKLQKMSESQKAQLLSIVGYADSEESASVAKKIGVSGVLTSLYAYPYIVGIAGAIALEKANPLIHLEDISSRSTQLTIALSYLLSYSAAFVNSQSNIRLLRDPNINTCPNIFATGLYFILKKIVPEKELVADLGVRAGTFAPGLIQEPFAISSLFIPALGPGAVFARNIAGGLLNLGQAGINEIWLKRKGIKS
ncbi:hypothetical protein A3F29_01465 [Candidatus Roizmanbacteria bacterium RIFCSPHIGHO2_12_FULL_33_9]|uniref:Uncharacterized protein n=1 Tax=Candidatus Roizmanbacteria bacterium RIFCSPHIGHO2_12_FULL_33_9 TaxID=1802045 RepID=A0A1F7HJI7_9BACT|nr:MAG: hypothetical protein A3F29_01465 [Candidatus Roizmanbacteria bacterium RIFCSPHIGHO2_12_FULL_33_9]